jgi:hypothetical protein
MCNKNLQIFVEDHPFHGNLKYSKPQDFSEHRVHELSSAISSRRGCKENGLAWACPCAEDRCQQKVIETMYPLI